MYDCFGVALDLKLRGMDWGFTLGDVQANVYMRHSRFDTAVPFVTAAMTSELLPNCKFEIIESDVHFSKEALDDYIDTVIAAHYKSTKKQI
jgi:hypothetical protein